MKLTLGEIVLALNAELAGNPTIEVTRVTTDSRDVRAGDLFVALKGERFDGHDYAVQALNDGAVAVLVSAPVAAQPSLHVADTLAALGQLATFWRNRIDPVVVAITGSNGKTTVKEMTATVLRELAGSDAVLATSGNLNNHIGVPLTLLSLEPRHRYAVVEMGMSDFGEIDYLTRMARPDVAMVNNAASAHLENLGSVAGVAKAKGEIFGGLKADGVALINADDAFAEEWAQTASGWKQVTFGLRTAEIGARDVEIRADSAHFILDTPVDDAGVELAVPGQHNVRNALAAAAVAYVLGFPVNAIARALCTYQGVAGRLQAKVGQQGCRVIDDSYNANPDSMKAAIDVLVAASGPTVLVLGDIGEAGSEAAAMHAEVGAYARERGVGALLCLGDMMRHAADAFGTGAVHFDSAEALIAALQPTVGTDSTVLVKGSRFMKMERVVHALTEGC
ncbi:UDP-N-acetylmuramoyl-tripeptide--D-alanyl-D-alanine ligase [Chitinibacteraceae bacterium HSL-7]